ncbi:MAG: Crp/Fnr family transcriptional regulator [Bacteroidota bacterium]
MAATLSYNQPEIPKGNLLPKNIQRYVALTPLEYETVFSFFTEKHVVKKKKVILQGKSCSKFYFVERGSLRAYHTNTEGKESTIMFAIEDWWITDMGAFLNQTSANLSLETLEDSLLYELDERAFQALLKELPKLERYFRILFQRAYVREQQRVLDAISMPLEDRYLRFLNKYPKIAAKVTQRQIASYLGVTPEFLSMVKNKSSS